jgi:hypothetical protein
METIQKHLAIYGISQFRDDRYWEWAGQRLTRKMDREPRPILFLESDFLIGAGNEQC